jgi:hypothetical protein
MGLRIGAPIVHNSGETFQLPAQECEMRGFGIPELVFLFVPMALVGLLFYGAIFFCIWKFYQLLSKIDDNLAGIRQAVERGGTSRPGLPV